MGLTINDLSIDSDEGYVELWRVRGINGRLFPNKVIAEMAARRVFPIEDPDHRYARISFIRFVTEDLK